MSTVMLLACASPNLFSLLGRAPEVFREEYPRIHSALTRERSSYIDKKGLANPMQASILLKSVSLICFRSCSATAFETE
jgi:hypothetical protein